MLKSTFYFLFLFFTFLSFSAVTYNPPWTSSSMEFFAFIAVIFLFFSRKAKSVDININILYLFVLILISIASYFTLHGSYEKFIIFIIYCLASIIVSSVKNSDDDYLKYIEVLVIVCLFNSFVIFIQKFNLIDDHGIWIAGYEDGHGRPYANFGQPNLAATLILCGLYSVVYLKNLKKISIFTEIITVLLFSIALAYTASKTSFLNIGVIFIFSVFLRRKNEIFVFLFAICVIIIFSNVSDSRQVLGVDISTGRFDLWSTIADGIAHSPWFGYGALNTRLAHFEVREFHIASSKMLIGSAHNIFLDFIVWFGIVFGILISILFIYLIYKFLKNNKNYINYIFILSPLFFHLNFEYPLFYANFLFMFVFLIKRNSRKIISVNNLLINILAVIFISIFIKISFEYNNLKNEFVNLRFFENNFSKAKKPELLNYYFLSETIGQFNIFLKDEIHSESDYLDISEITKFNPAFKNFYLLIKYDLIFGNINNVNYWLTKAKFSLNEGEYNYLEKISKAGTSP